MSFKCGTVALIGRPNAGKSTLLNQILGSKLAIISAKPQTTRHRIAGIHNSDTCQIVLLDTPGLHTAWTELNKSMVRRSLDAIKDVDLLCWLVDTSEHARRFEAKRPILDAEDEWIVEALEKAKRPVFLIANKIDVVPKPLILPVIDALNSRLPVAAALPISALTGDGVPPLLDILQEHLPEHPPLFPQDEWAQVTERFIASEIIREKIFHLTEQEIPYSSHVVIERFDETERETKSLVKIYAKVSVERGSQKGILIGKKGEMLKRIGTMARKDLQSILGCRVYLEIFVNVEENWTRSAKGLRKVGYDER